LLSYRDDALVGAFNRECWRQAALPTQNGVQKKGGTSLLSPRAPPPLRDAAPSRGVNMGGDQRIEPPVQRIPAPGFHPNDHQRVQAAIQQAQQTVRQAELSIQHAHAHAHAPGRPPHSARPHQLSGQQNRPPAQPPRQAQAPQQSLRPAAPATPAAPPAASAAPLTPLELRVKAEAQKIRREEAESGKQRAVAESEQHRTADQAARQRAAEAEKKRVADEASRQRQADQAARQRAAEAEKKRVADEASRQRQADQAASQRQAEEAARHRKVAEDAERQRKADETTRQRQTDEAERQRKAEEAARQRAAEAERKKRADDEAARQRAAEEAARQKLAAEQAAASRAPPPAAAPAWSFIKTDEDEDTLDDAARATLAKASSSQRRASTFKAPELHPETAMGDSGTGHMPLPKDIIGIYSNHGCKFDKDGKALTINQDRGCITYPLAGDLNMMLMTVNDGHGPSGEQISEFVMQKIPEILENDPRIHSDPEAALTHAFIESDRALKDAKKPAQASGTTGVAVLLKGNEIWTANVGDSRAIVARRPIDGSRLKAVPLTVDQKPDDPDERARISKTGAIITDSKPDEPARVWTSPNGIGLAMARSIGDHAFRKYGIIPTPVIRRFNQHQDNTHIIIASDGVWEFMSNETVIETVGRTRDSTEAVCELIKLATESWRREEGDYRDDITAIVCKMPLLPLAPELMAKIQSEFAEEANKPRLRALPPTLTHAPRSNSHSHSPSHPQAARRPEGLVSPRKHRCAPWKRRNLPTARARSTEPRRGISSGASFR
jgi:serine/threonine protein phosphatase PrpC